MFNKKLFLFAGIAILILSPAYGQELLDNNNWEKMKGSIPLSWNLYNYNGQSKIKLTMETFKNNKVALIVSDNLKGRGYIGQTTNIQLPAGKSIVLSGYYRTKDIALSSKGKLYADIIYNYGSKDEKFPKIYQAILFKPSEKWQKFESVRALNVPVKNFSAFFMLSSGSGKLYLSGLSLRVQESSSKIDNNEKYIWREAEDIAKHDIVSTWGKEHKEYFSGKGGISRNRSPFKWNFRINQEIDESTLKPKKRNFFVWVRLYGYRQKPNVTVFLNKNKICSFKTKGNEKVDARGNYVGPGKYYWQRAGSFRSSGGDNLLNIVPSGNMQLDAILVTTDSKYAPVLYEARKAADKKLFGDIKTPYAVKSEFSLYGISNKVITPLCFRYQGKDIQINAKEEAAVFHISLPSNIKIKNISTHWAGKTWNSPNRWGNKLLSFRQTGTEEFKGVQHNKYEIYLYYLQSAPCYVFVQAEKDGFKAGQRMSCKYYLEYKGKKQLTESLPLLTVAMKNTTAFKKIMIGPCGGNARSFYQEFPEIAENMKFNGMNIINVWTASPNQNGKRWKNFRDQCVNNNIAILGAFGPFWGIYAIKDKKFMALSINGKSDGGRPAFAINKECKALRKSLDYLTNQGRQGVTGIVLDNESFNQKKDKYDYNPLTLKKFQKYCTSKGIKYINPKIIIKDKQKYAKEYQAWIDFKCDSIVNIFRYFQQAYLKGAAEAPNSSTMGQNLFIPQILKDRSPVESKINSYWDYKKLATVSDYISPMIYTYSGVAWSAMIGDTIEMYNEYIGKKVIIPTLLCEHYGFGHIGLKDKVMFKYQVLESLMQQSRIIFFWFGSSVYNPINTQHISEAIRWTAPYEDIILKGKKFNGVILPKWVRLKGLKLNNRILLYLTNYRNSIDKKAKIKFKSKIKSVLEIGTGKQLPIKNNSFSVDFKSDRGKLFIIKQ